MLRFGSKKNYKTLAIIGNGFDIAHGYKTDYRSFVEKTSNQSLDAFRSYCEDEDSITTWYLFEENISKLTSTLFMRSFSDDCDYDAVRADVTQLKEIFNDIHELLLQFLRTETASKQIKTIPSIKKYLKRKTKVITFNYTDIAEEYTNDIYYVHGSIKENDILLGYDYRDEPCLAQYEDMCWSKTICRESLAFRRYLRNELHLEVDSPEYARLISSLETYHHWDNSGRGIDEDANTYIPDFDILSNFIHQYRENNEILNISYHRISTIVVLGHGIEADQVFLNRILRKCKNLKKVVIFRYDGESDSSFNNKANFFRPYCKRIRSVMYH